MTDQLIETEESEAPDRLEELVEQALAGKRIVLTRNGVRLVELQPITEAGAASA